MAPSRSRRHLLPRDGRLASQDATPPRGRTSPPAKRDPGTATATFSRPDGTNRRFGTVRGCASGARRLCRESRPGKTSPMAARVTRDGRRRGRQTVPKRELVPRNGEKVAARAGPAQTRHLRSREPRPDDPPTRPTCPDAPAHGRAPLRARRRPSGAGLPSAAPRRRTAPRRSSRQRPPSPGRPPCCQPGSPHRIPAAQAP